MRIPTNPVQAVVTGALLMHAQLAAFADTWAPAQVNLVLVLVLEALHLCDQVAARRQTLPLLPPASLNYACACLLPLLFLRRPPRRCVSMLKCAASFVVQVRTQSCSCTYPGSVYS